MDGWIIHNRGISTPYLRGETVLCLHTREILSQDIFTIYGPARLVISRKEMFFAKSLVISRKDTFLLKVKKINNSTV